MDALFATDNHFDVPLLDINLQGDAVDLPVHVWGDKSRALRKTGTICFYTDDYRFSALWSKPDMLLKNPIPTVVEPNFTVANQTPYAVALYNTYKKRWLASYWQQFGKIRIFVDMNVGGRYTTMNLLGVPKGWRAYSTRGYTDDLSSVERAYAAAVQHRGSDDVLFMVYSGGEAARELCVRLGAVWVVDRFYAKDLGVRYV